MALFSIPDVKIKGMAAAVPTNRVHNLDLSFLEKSEREAFIRTVGIGSRCVAPSGLCASDLCIAAARQILLQEAQKTEDIGAVVFVTQTPDYLLPGNSMLVQRQLGLSSATLLLDLNQGCAGYVYGLSTLTSLMHAAHIDKGLLLVGDTITRFLSPHDRSTVPIFSDAGSATLLERSANAAPMYFNLGADGKGAEVIRVKGGGARHPFGPESLMKVEEAPGILRAPIHLSMQGVDVLHYSLRNVVSNINTLLEFAHVNLDEPDYFVFHQANRMLNESILKKIGIPPEKAPETLSEFGNTSSATIPLTICARLRKCLSEKPHKILLSGFGVGFSWGSAIIDTDPFFCADLLEMKDPDEN